jgi:hypothetical protein
MEQSRPMNRAISRGTFSKGLAGGVAAAPALLPASSLGRDGQAAPGEQVVLGEALGLSQRPE